MQRVKVSSSNIHSIGYELTSNILEVQFLTGSVYQYYNVPSLIHSSLMSASSHGSYLAAHVKGAYRYKQIS
ncbi:KTSC domain-containing protein [Clostridium estertheticum]|uniref:KTSC domain-containing protein n=1 Tax=Clostridium estertheticum TaxID=238834 RepID=UPI001C0B4B86|nr:KTSC domain-containing protein [Clostridium estertheticum]MBU3185630.1 KTSC domain-containing protein [Clostridium estertheticum]